MPSVNTVNGGVDTSKLGFTLMHEHVFARSPGVFENWPQLWDPQQEIERAMKLLTEAKGAGVDTILDLTTIDLGRDVPLVQQVAPKVDINIIVATGIWLNTPMYVERMMDADQLAEVMARDIQVGIADTGVKAGAIKVATEPTMDSTNEVILRAAARAHRGTGAPISTHTYPRNKTGLTQQDVFASEGVDLGRVVIGHSGDSEDVEYLSALIRRGSYIGMDRFGIERLLPDDKRIAVVARMCEMGHANKMVLSHDTNCWFDTMPPDLKAQQMPLWTYQHITKDIIPVLKKSGVTQAQIDMMTIENPRRIFEAQGSY